MTVYLVDEPFLDTAMAYASNDEEARIVLLQDAVYFATRGKSQGQLYAIGEDVRRRGLESRIPSWVRVIGYSDLVEMMEKEKVVNFL